MSLLAPLRYQRITFKKLLNSFCQHKTHRNIIRCLSSIGKCNLNSNSNSISLHHRGLSSKTQLNLAQQNEGENKLFDFHHEWTSDDKAEFLRDMILIEDFVSEAEEERLFAEVQKTMKRMRYQYDHWDNAIDGFREMEKTDWLPENELVFQRLRSRSFVANVLPHVHILDLAADGIIKPHVDSSRYCGSTIAGLSLLTDCIMRLRRVDEEHYKQNRQGDKEQAQGDSENKELERSENTNSNEFKYFADILLKRRSLYIMKDSARYKFSHEVLASKSTFRGNEIIKDRRISIICRNQA